MSVPTPPKLLEAIAADAGAGFITNPMPEAPPGGNFASIQGGFPPKTMQNELAGGLPPLGQDMNGFLFLISSHTLYVETGQTYKFDSDVATAIGGYPVGTVLGMADGTGMWLSIAAANTSNPDTGGAGWVPITSYGSSTVVVTGGTVTLTSAQSRKGVIILSGALISNLTINLPQGVVQEWLIVNGTSGAFATTVKTAASGSQGVFVPQGGFGAPVGVYSVGNGNIYPTVAPLGIPIDQGPTPLTIVERDNAGNVLATYFYQTSGNDENPAINQFMVTNGDGFLRKAGITYAESQMLLQGIGGQVSNGQVPFSAVAQWAAALFSSPAFTGVPTAPTAGLGTSNSQVATTAFANPGVTINGNGICINLPNGFKLQAGSCNPAGGAAAVTFPVAFTSRVDAVIAISIAGAAVQTWLPGAPSLAGVTVRNTGGSAYWFAIGA